MKHQDRHARPDGGFSCVHCKSFVSHQSFGTRQRNHCPSCLWSRHVDEKVGDRRSACNQPMEPIAIASRGDGEWAIVHRCVGCGHLRINRVAGDDDELALLALALRPVSNPTFPIDLLPRLRGGV
ncbi:MAG: RNHCP domain-containing protein [Planctomycetota bacterium]|nr:MAG: RNHCP domain-containing protein [Planctomycetota bacterium]